MENWAIGMLFFHFFEQNGKNEKMVRINMIFFHFSVFLFLAKNGKIGK